MRSSSPVRLSGFPLAATLVAVGLLLTNPVSITAATPEEEAQAAELVKAADEARAKADAAEQAVQAAQTKATELQAQLIRLKAEATKAEAAVKESEGKLKPEQEKVQKAEADYKPIDDAAKAAAAAVETLKKQLADAEAKSKAEAEKAAAAAKVVSDAQAALKAVEMAIATAKKSMEDALAGSAQTEKTIAEFKTQFDQTEAQFATLDRDHVEKRRAAETMLIKLDRLVSFADSVAPIFAKRCLACHNARTAKGRYNMETFAGIVKGGESGEALVAGDAEGSTLLAMIEDGSMPKDADPLTADEIASVKKWIATGAVLNAGFKDSQPLIQIMPKLPQPPAPEVYPVPVPVTAVAFSPDGGTLATSGYHEVILWKVADGTVARRITNVAERVYDLEFSKDGQKLIVAAGTPAQIGEAKIFQVSDGAVLADLVRTDDSVFAVALSPDETLLATAGADRSIRIYDVATHEQKLLIEDHADWVMDVNWAPDGSKLVSASRDKTSKVFDAKTGDSLVTFNGHGESVYGAAFSPDGSQGVTSGSDKQIRTWAVADAKQVRAIGGFGGEVFRISVTADGVAKSSASP